MATKNRTSNTEKNDDVLPSEVTLESHYSFFDDAGEFFQWVEGSTETNAERIAMLIERKAPITEVTA